jgi:excinuclease ABC subunit C
MLAGSAVSTNFRPSAFSRRFSNRNNFLLEIAAIYSKQNWFQILAATINPCCGYVAIGPGISPGADPRCILDPMLELDCGLPFFPEFDADFFAALPARPGVILLEMKAPKAEPYLARTADIRRAAERLLATPEAQSKRLNLREVVGNIRYSVTGSKFEQSLLHYQIARSLFPQRYRTLARIRPPAMLKVNLRNSYPRCYVTRQIRADEGFYFGPFPSRRFAEDFSEGFLDLFKTRRCQIKIRRDPNFPGCIYSEMKMCLAPCFAGCTQEEYDREVGYLLEGLSGQGAVLAARLEHEREAASEALDFERAAALHKRLEKVDQALRGIPDIVRRVEDLDAVILQRGADPQSIAVFPLHRGTLVDPFHLHFGEVSEPRSVEATLRAAFEPLEAVTAGSTQLPVEKTAQPTPQEIAEPNIDAQRGLFDGPQPDLAPAERKSTSDAWREQYGLRRAPPFLSEHLSLVSRWFYSKPRDGEILFRTGDWPYRRILRACARLLNPHEKNLIPPSPSQPPQP